MNWKKGIAFVLAGTMLAGCSSSSASAGSSSAGEAEGGGSDSITVAMDADLTTMDYEVATDGNSFIMQTMCEAGLVELDDKGQPEPDLAESWDISEDGLTYTFHLRDGLKWSDGTDLTANDFVYGWQRLVSPDLASEYNFIMTTIGVTNAADVTSGAKPLSDLGVEATDDQTFVVHLDQPCGFLLGLMAFPSFFPLNQAFYESKGDQYAVGGTDDLLYCGPYTMTDWVQGNHYTFTKNPDYWNADAINTDSVTFQFQQDTQTAMLAFTQGQMDVVKLASEQVDAYKGEDGFTTRLTGYAWRIDYNTDTCEELKNKDLREAIFKAVDRQSITDDVLKDGSVPAEGFIPQEFAYGTDGTDYRETAGSLINAEADTEGAQAAYEKAKAALGGDVTLKLIYEDSEACKAVAENLKSQIETALPGITIELNQTTKKARLDSMDSRDNTQYQLGLTRWGPDYADPQTYLDLFKSDTSGYDAKNVTYYNDAYDALMNKAETGEDSTDAAKRWADLVEAEKMLLDDYAMCPIYQNGGAMMIQPGVTGIEFHNAGVDNYRHITRA
jgi:oligopeptide transport system substrate-binding protein